MTAQILQTVGALAILVPFGWTQLGSLEAASLRYLGLNLIGSALLASLAAASAQWGFLLLEGCWALVSALNLGRTLLRWLSCPRSGVAVKLSTQKSTAP